jgi:hypothetical protein
MRIFELQPEPCTLYKPEVDDVEAGRGSVRVVHSIFADSRAESLRAGTFLRDFLPARWYSGVSTQPHNREVFSTTEEAKARIIN